MLCLGSVMQVVLELLCTGPYSRGVRVVKRSTPEMLTSKVLNTISAYLSISLQLPLSVLSRSIGLCIFFSPKAFCDNQKVV